MAKILNKINSFSNKFTSKAAVENDNELLNQADTDEIEAYNKAESEEETEGNNNGAWLEEDYEEGQLSIDVFQTPEALIIKSTIAGVKPKDIDISLNNDMLTIRGKREMDEIIREENYLFKECYWGSFSRSIILPVEIQEDKIEAQLENGVLTVILPKAKASKQIFIKVTEK
jgi:HSP20 family protein